MLSDRQNNHLCIFILISICLLQFAYSESDMEKMGVVPDVITKPPGGKLVVKFGSSEVNNGNVLTPTQVKNTPKVEWEADDNAFYTLCLTDPDAPSRKDPKNREWQHWLVVNIPGNHINEGEVLTGYVSSAPPKGSGLHRYVFLVYKQPRKITFEEQKISATSGKNRSKFSISNFAKRYNLGDPAFGNFYQAEWDEYVPRVYEKLKG
uniref:Secreted Phosphatidylethanolamine-binding protein-like protein n=1 Tax=Pristhesancus plagipennis TaxID=1955184 RepID=A0A2K8JM73_PRIPG|nr:secreted Phosphatidylethanolamine-binding protein-like protein [Pristhesancus plagipennis]